ncbi:MAG: leucine-rich repeat domain-containing protein [Bacteroidaceae bacterium]|nr:leucine-rich repeat domain-containing protein [Bacteroidaceae bacterium]
MKPFKTPKRSMKRIMLLLVLLACGLNAYAYCNDYGYVVINGVKYHLFYRTWTKLFETQSDHEAYVEEFTGTSTEIVIPATITDGGQTYNVKGLRYNPMTEQITATLSSNYVQTIRVENKFSFYPDDSNPTFNCPNLKTIYFEGASPWFSGLYTSYFASPATKKITVYLSDKTEQEISDMTTNAAVWSDFLRVLPMSNINVKRNVNLSISHARLQVGDNYYVNDKSLQVDMYSDLTFYVYKEYSPWILQSVRVNGQEIIDEMVDAGTYCWFELKNITSDVYISVMGEKIDNEVNVICSYGGTCYSPDANISGGVIQPNNRQTIRWNKSEEDGSYLKIIPNEGYTLDKVYYNSFDNTYMVTDNGDGTFTYPLTASAEVSVLFKEISPTKVWNLETTVGLINVYARFLDKRGEWTNYQELNMEANTVPADAQQVDFKIVPMQEDGADGAQVIAFADGENLSSYFNGNYSFEYEKVIFSTEDVAERIPADMLKATSWVFGLVKSDNLFFWTLNATGDVGASTAQITSNDDSQTWSVDSEHPVVSNYIHSDPTYTFTVQLAPRYSFTASFNGTDYTEQFVRGTVAGGKVPYTLSLLMSDEAFASLYAHGKWTVNFAPKPAESIIEFVDQAVKQICVDNWDTDGDGELSKKEAGEVTSLLVDGTSVFKSKYGAISSFDEFQFFTGLTKIEEQAFHLDSLKSIILPPTITSIEKEAFYGCRIQTIDIPEGVTSIGQSAFNSCANLENIVLPKSLTSIGNYAFAYTSIRQIFIPKNVNSITPGVGANIFSGCSKLVSIDVDKDNVKFDSRNNCSSIIEKTASGGTLVYGCKNSIVPEGVNKIGIQAFKSAGIKKMVIPSSVTSISIFVFADNMLDTLVMKRETPIAFDKWMFIASSAETTPASISNCVLVVPVGTKDAYATAGWKSIEDGGCFKEVVEEVKPAYFDVNGDGLINVSDVTALVNKILHP